MVTAVIFAGGIGERMNSRARPKQFLEIHGKPIIIYTVEIFERHPEIDNICVVCLESWIDELKHQLERNYIKKVKYIVPGGSTGHDSVYNGLAAIKDDMKENDLVVIHDGVRPLITDELVSENIRVARKKRSAVTVATATESISEVDKNGKIKKIPNRSAMRIIKAPQTFYFRDIWVAHQRAKEDDYKSIDSACLMQKYGYPIETVESSTYNIKITTPSDYYIFRAIYEATENLQIFGL